MASRRPRAILIWTSCPKNFANENSQSLNSSSDDYLRAIFHTELYKQNHDLFACFFGGVEMCTLLHVVTDQPRPVGESEIFLRLYEETGCWDQRRCGPFPFDMNAWQWTRITLDEMEMVCLLLFLFPTQRTPLKFCLGTDC